MNEILNERFQILQRRLLDEDFLSQQRTIIPYFLFTYDLKDEEFVKKGIQDTLNLTLQAGQKVTEVNLFDVFEAVFEEDLEAIEDLLVEEGLDAVMDAIEPTIDDGISIVDAFETLAGESDIVFLTGAGTAYPFLHTSGLLKRLSVSGNARPIIVFYPGKFNGTQLSLFGKHEMTENEYQIYTIA